MLASRLRVLPSLACVILVSGGILSASAAQAADATDCRGFQSDLTQLVRPAGGANLLSRWPAEIANAKHRFGFTQDQGVIAQVADRPAPGLTPVWRLYRGGDFVWATDGADADRFVAAGYIRQFVDFSASLTGTSCMSALNRLERKGVHRVATGQQTPGLMADGWVNGGPAFYAVVARESASPPPPVNPPPPPPLPPNPPTPGTDTKFSIAVIPDTQNEVSSPSLTRFANRVSWLVSNRQRLDIRYAMQAGDLSSWGNVDPAQFLKASNEVKPLEAVIPWTVAAGNHDTAAVCTGGSACPGGNASLAVRDVSTFNRYFPPSRFPNDRGTYEPGKSENAYATFSAGGKDWMVLTLELWARPAVVAWAGQVVAANPKRNVIVVTHSYLEANGSISTSNGGYGATSPQYLFENLIKLYPNIKMVLSGHVGQAATRTDVGRAGNKIVSFLQAFHSITNPVRIIEIDTAADTVSSQVYAPATDTQYPQYSTSASGVDFG